MNSTLIERCEPSVAGPLMRRILRLDHVGRWAVVPTVEKQSVAEHSFNVANIADWFAEYHENHADPEFRLNVMRHALRHDNREAITGDIPSPAKAKGEVTTREYLNDLPEDVGVVVKVADRVEALTFVRRQTLMGMSDYYAQPIMDEILDGYLTVMSRFKARPEFEVDMGGGRALRDRINRRDMAQLLIARWMDVAFPTLLVHPAMESEDD